jgi:hypothetical protein
MQRHVVLLIDQSAEFALMNFRLIYYVGMKYY